MVMAIVMTYDASDSPVTAS